VLLAAAVTAGTLVALWHGLTGQAPAVQVAIPWRPIGGTALACLVVALLASLVPAALLLRRRPVELAGTRE
jgi:putative ABC transport system permease protein